MVLELVALVAGLTCAVLAGGFTLGRIYERTSAGGGPGRRQSVRASRAAAGSPVDAVVADAPPRPLETPEAEADWLGKERDRILVKLAREYPKIGTGRRNQLADEIMRKARVTLARIR